MIHFDKRGSFQKPFSFQTVQSLIDETGIDYKLRPIVDANESFTRKAGVIRGLHMQMEPASETKIVRCAIGKIWDVCVDMRPSSPTYLKYFGYYIQSASAPHNHPYNITNTVIVPRGFAHGFQTLTENCLVEYLVDCKYHPELELKIYPLDQELSIPWPEPVNVNDISDADRKALSLKDAKDILSRDNT